MDKVKTETTIDTKIVKFYHSEWTSHAFWGVSFGLTFFTGLDLCPENKNKTNEKTAFASQDANVNKSAWLSALGS